MNHRIEQNIQRKKYRARNGYWIAVAKKMNEGDSVLTNSYGEMMSLRNALIKHFDAKVTTTGFGDGTYRIWHCGPGYAAMRRAAHAERPISSDIPAPE